MAWPLAALGQQAGGRRRLGVLVGFAKGDPESERWLKALLERLGQLGWRNDNNLEIDLRWGGMDLDQIKKSAKELVKARPDVIQSHHNSGNCRDLTGDAHRSCSVCDRIGPGRLRLCSEPGSPRWKCDRFCQHRRINRNEMA